MHVDSGSGQSSGVATSEILSPVVEKEQVNFNQFNSSDNQLSDLDSKLKQINAKSTDNVDVKEHEQTTTEVKGDTTKTVERTASSNNNATTATIQVRVY